MRTALAALLCMLAAAPDPIALIRERYRTIERELPHYAHREVDFDGQSLEGGTLDVYRAGTEIRKLRATLYGETGRLVESHYYWNGRLFFVLSTTEHYDRPLSGRVVRREEGRFYFEGTSLIRWLSPSTTSRPLTGPEADEALSALREIDQAMISAAREAP